ncbi:Transcription factor SMP1 [Erysiphe necator]|nr:Transcription factor SMP1 [Erysiphe necator]
MGRRKIEIKAIKDDRNRSVTFLKRKGGLFKKAHELSVLCSVDVAVIIFGSNKKLYEYSSSDLGEILTRYQYYGGANEHKGPEDFNGKDKLDDDDDDDDGSIPSHHGSVEPHMMPSQFQNQVAYQHMRHQTPSASPPISSGSAFPHPVQRKHTPQPQLPDKKPSSRNGGPRTSSNLVQQLSQPPNGFAYMSNPGIYNSQNVAMPTSHPHSLSSHMQASSMQGPPIQNHSLQGSQYANYPPPSNSHIHSHQHQMRHTYLEDQRKLTMPTAPQERLPTRPGSCPPHQVHEPSDVEIKQETVPAPQALQPVKRMSVKSRSIFTPIDESRSILSQHWASSTSKFEAPRSENPSSNNRLQSVESKNSQVGKYPAPTEGTPSQNTTSTSGSTPESLPPPSRADSASLAGGKRPILKVQIPDEPSDEGSATADSTSSPSGTNATSSQSRPNGNTTDSLSSGLVLPPPSPSAGGSLLSAGATGPPNPFARPPPIQQNPQSNGINGNGLNGNSSNGNNNGNSNQSNNSNSGNNGNNSNNGNLISSNHTIETPVSALPSRFMTNEFLPSPSSFYPEWNFRSGDGNTLPSPLNFATPVLGTGPSFLREDITNKEINKDASTKRTGNEDEMDRLDSKRIKVE